MRRPELGAEQLGGPVGHDLHPAFKPAGQQGAVAGDARNFNPLADIGIWRGAPVDPLTAIYIPDYRPGRYG